MPSFAAPVIGGALLAGGHASVAGAIGAGSGGFVTQALVLFRVDPFFVELLLGLVILAAVALAASEPGRRRTCQASSSYQISISPSRGSALHDVSIRFAAGSIHALVGENGAGKSTLIKVITRVHPPDRGTVRIDGVPVNFNGPIDADAAGIGVVHQERNLIPSSPWARTCCSNRLPPASNRSTLLDCTQKRRAGSSWWVSTFIRGEPSPGSAWRRCR